MCLCERVCLYGNACGECSIVLYYTHIHLYISFFFTLFPFTLVVFVGVLFVVFFVFTSLCCCSFFRSFILFGVVCECIIFLYSVICSVKRCWRLVNFSCFVKSRHVNKKGLCVFWFVCTDDFVIRGEAASMYVCIIERQR